MSKLSFHKKAGQSSKISQIQKAEDKSPKSKVNKITKIKSGNHEQPIPESGNYDPEFSFLVSGITDSGTPSKKRNFEMSTLYDCENFTNNQNGLSLSIDEIVKIIKNRSKWYTKKVHLFYYSNLETPKTKRAVKSICDTLNFEGFRCDVNSMYTKNFDPDI